MEPFLNTRRRRRRRRLPPERTAPRRARIVGRAAPRPATWWLVFGLLVLAWWFPLAAQAQGLRSTTTSVSLIATRLPDAPRQLRDIPWDVGFAAESSLVVQLVDGPTGSPLYVRDASGRLVSLGTDGVRVLGPQVMFRVMDPERYPADARWQVVLVRAGVPERRLDVRPRQLR